MKHVDSVDLVERAHDDVSLTLARDYPADPARGWLRALHYDIRVRATGEIAGNIDLRLGFTTHVALYGGHFGYGVKPTHRGRHYAGKALLGLRGVAAAFGLDVTWITCNPDNWASRKTCEYVGAELVEIVDLPPDCDMYLEGERQKCRYRWVLY